MAHQIKTTTTPKGNLFPTPGAVITTTTPAKAVATPTPPAATGTAPATAAPAATAPVPTTTSAPAASTPTTTVAPAPAAAATPSTPKPGAPGHPVTHAGARSETLSTAAIGAVLIAAILVLACVAWALARQRALEPRWTLTLRHAIAEAAYRTSATWAEFTDWARLGH